MPKKIAKKVVARKKTVAKKPAAKKVAKKPAAKKKAATPKRVAKKKAPRPAAPPKAETREPPADPQAASVEMASVVQRMMDVAAAAPYYCPDHRPRGEERDFAPLVAYLDEAADVVDLRKRVMLRVTLGNHPEDVVVAAERKARAMGWDLEGTGQLDEQPEPATPVGQPAREPLIVHVPTLLSTVNDQLRQDGAPAAVEVVSVPDHGAKCDGATDDSAAVASAITAAGADPEAPTGQQ